MFTWKRAGSGKLALEVGTNNKHGMHVHIRVQVPVTEVQLYNGVRVTGMQMHTRVCICKPCLLLLVPTSSRRLLGSYGGRGRAYFLGLFY